MMTHENNPPNDPCNPYDPDRANDQGFDKELEDGALSLSGRYEARHLQRLSAVDDALAVRGIDLGLEEGQSLFDKLTDGRSELSTYDNQILLLRAKKHYCTAGDKQQIDDDLLNISSQRYTLQQQHVLVSVANYMALFDPDGDPGFNGGIVQDVLTMVHTDMDKHSPEVRMAYLDTLSSLTGEEAFTEGLDLFYKSTAIKDARARADKAKQNAQLRQVLYVELYKHTANDDGIIELVDMILRAKHEQQNAPPATAPPMALFLSKPALAGAYRLAASLGVPDEPMQALLKQLGINTEE